MVITALLSGLVVGSMSGLVGIGGGVLLVPILLYLFKMEIHMAAGTSLAIVIPTAMLALGAHLGKGHIDWRVAGLITLGAAAGALLGTWLGGMMSGEALKKVFAVMLILMTTKVVADAFGWSRPVATPQIEQQAQVSATSENS